MRAFHAAQPLQVGISRAELKASVAPGTHPAVFEAALSKVPALVEEGGVIRMRTHKVLLQKEETEASQRIEHAFEQAGLAVPSTSEVLAGSGIAAERARSVLQVLLRNRQLVKITDELVFHASAIQALKTALQERRGTLVGIPEFKSWFGLSRKYAIPLLEYLDREHVTRREGESRKVL